MTPTTTADQSTEPATTTPPRQRHRPLAPAGQFVHGRVSQLQREFLADRSDLSAKARAHLAQLRRGIGKDVGALPELWQTTLEGLPLPEGIGDTPTPIERATYTAITLYALHQQSRTAPMHHPGIGLGTAVRQLSRRTASEAAVQRRFHALGTASSFTETVQHARGLITQLRGESIAVDYGRLADDLHDLQNPRRADRVRLAWGRDFYRTHPTEPNTTADTDTEETA